MSRSDRILKHLMLKGIRLVLKFRTYLPTGRHGQFFFITFLLFTSYFSLFFIGLPSFFKFSFALFAISPFRPLRETYFANIWLGSWKDLNSSALPLGSRKNMVACSPTSPLNRI